METATMGHLMVGAVEPHFCMWLWGTMTIHCDGNVSCGLDDPLGVRSFGNVNTQSVREIWSNPAYEERRRSLLSGRLCEGCRLYTPVKDHGVPLPEPCDPLPDQLIVEPTVRCNLRCPQPACIPNNDPDVETRSRSHLSLETFRRVVEEIGPHLRRIYLFNYGEPFLHPQAEEMIAHAKQVNPHVWIRTSTNAIPLRAERRARAVVEAGTAEVIFTVAGSDQGGYERYHVRGRFDHAFEGMANVCRAKRELGADRPLTTWRYLLFRWNDSDEEIARARALAREIGVDRLRFHHTHEPAGATSLRRAPGSPGFELIRDQSDFAFHYGVAEPDDDGLYHRESIRLLGTARWTKPRARIAFEPFGPWLIIGLASSNPQAYSDPPLVTLRTPWGVTTAHPGFLNWRDVYIQVPPEHRDGRRVECSVEVDPPWIPSVTGHNDDQRELGVLIGPGHLGRPDAVGYILPSSADANGLYSPENHPTLGSCRWTAPLARFPLRPVHGTLALNFATICPNAGANPVCVTIRTPWHAQRVVADHGRWLRVDIPVPRALRRESRIPVTLEVEPAWRPGDLGMGEDERLLGVLVPEEMITEGRARREAVRWALGRHGHRITAKLRRVLSRTEGRLVAPGAAARPDQSGL